MNTKLYTALITPLNNDLTIDFDSLERIIKQQEENNIGILVLGSTGEGLNLTSKEKTAILDFVSELKVKVPVLIGLPGHDLETTIDFLKSIEKYDFDGYLAVTPIYAKPGKLGQYNWFKTILDTSTKPVMLYNVPSRSGISLNFDTVEMLNTHPKFWSIKEASGSVEDFKKYKSLLTNQKIFSGDDGLTFEFSKHGNDGLISVASNVWPKQTSKYLEQCLDQSLPKSELKTWEKSCDSLFSASNPIPAKALMSHLKTIQTPKVKPPLNDQDLANLDDLLISNLALQE